jgi:hypothetical protein
MCERMERWRGVGLVWFGLTSGGWCEKCPGTASHRRPLHLGGDPAYSPIILICNPPYLFSILGIVPYDVRSLLLFTSLSLLSLTLFSS